MRLLLDTHALIWFFLGDERLSARARAAILDPDATILLSAASAMEIAAKHRFGKPPQAERLVRDLSRMIAEQGFGDRPITTGHALRAGLLAIPHRDPCDRLLIDQSQMEGARLERGRLRRLGRDPAVVTVAYL